ncbi:MAG TPA: DUF4476 domain-containing protein [Chitinophagaceae bacterium]|nr:DUF4476 domain-containing protein [Chitinophagaceae bacterium]
MKRLIFILLAVLSFSAAFSQRLFFVYLQTDPAEPFFVKINDKVHSSTATGYLILSRLRDSSYAITVGFPQNKWPDQKFTINIKSKDRGYTIKNFGEKGWGLIDLETMSIQMSSAMNASSRTEPKEVSLFTEILSRAANDPSLKERPIAAKEDKPAVEKEEKALVNSAPEVKEEKPPVTVAVNNDTKKSATDSNTGRNEAEPAVKKDTVLASVKEDSLPPPALPVVPVQPDKEESADSVVPEYRPSRVIKKSESSVTDGLHLTFIDNYPDGKKDTIRIIIPNSRAGAEIKEPVREEKKFLDIRSDDTVKKEEPVQGKVKVDSVKSNPAVVKSKCPSIATESDFLKIRKKMAAETNDDAMVAEAKKYFKTKCFSSLQVKNLSTLFLSDSGKYKFFDAAYEYVSDKENFPGLAAELKDDYYINRFKAMLR